MKSAYEGGLLGFTVLVAFVCGNAAAQEKRSQVTPTQANVSYGPAARNVLDFYQAESATPTPLIIYIHGGGFVGGDKTSISPAMIRVAHQAGISVAALNYRFVDGVDVIFLQPQRDCARALQTLRSQA